MPLTTRGGSTGPRRLEMHVLAAVPALVAFYIGIKKGFVRAYLDVYLPAIILLPDYFSTKIIPGVPPLNFNQAAMLPCALLFFMFNDRKWKWSFVDFLVTGYVASIIYSEYINIDYKEAQNLGFILITTVWLPYVLTKGIVEPMGLREEFAKRITLLFAICTATLTYETRMGRPLIRIPLDPFFPGQGYWVTTFRWGLARAAGPYGHSIVSGMMFVVAYRIARWVEWAGYWKEKVPYISQRVPFPLSKARFFTLVTAAGLILTLVRGPWMGAIAAAGLIFICRSKNRGAYITIAIALFIVVGIPAGISFYQYVSVGRENALTVAQESAAYRWELITEYGEIAGERLYWGWGRNLWPEVPGMPSIDNNFLLLALNHGTVALGFFNFAQFWLMFHLIRLGVKKDRNDPIAILAFSLAGIIIAMIVSLATVGLLSNIIQLFFMVLGWCDGLVKTKGVPVPKPVVIFRYPRIMATQDRAGRVMT